MPGSYVVHQQVRLTGTFRNAAGELKDPTTVTVKVQDATGAQTIYTFAAAEVVRDSEGVYHKDIEITKPSTGGGGVWYYRFEGTGAVVAAFESQFGVEQTVF
jgi:hypothetical protein